MQRTQNAVAVKLVNHTFLKGSLQFLSLSFHGSCKLHPLWCNLGMLDICPEPIMNFYFHLEFGFAWRDRAGWMEEWRHPETGSSQLGVCEVHLDTRELSQLCTAGFSTVWHYFCVSGTQNTCRKRRNGCWKYSVEKVRCSAAAFPQMHICSSTCEIKSVMKWWFYLITKCKIVLLFWEVFTFSSPFTG